MRVHWSSDKTIFVNGLSKTRTVVYDVLSAVARLLHVHIVNKEHQTTKLKNSASHNQPMWAICWSLCLSVHDATCRHKHMLSSTLKSHVWQYIICTSGFPDWIINSRMANSQAHVFICAFPFTHSSTNTCSLDKWNTAENSYNFHSPLAQHDTVTLLCVILCWTFISGFHN